MYFCEYTAVHTAVIGCELSTATTEEQRESRVLGGADGRTEDAETSGEVTLTADLFII